MQLPARVRVSQSVPVKARCPIVTSSCIQQAMQDCYAQTAAACSHGNLRLPRVCDGIIRLHCCEVRGAIIPKVICVKNNLKSVCFK